MVFCFEKGLEYRTINSRRSAISAYHNHIDGHPVGQHPLVCKVMKGISNNNPPKPKHVFIWDVEDVLTYLRSLPPNSELDLKMLTQKTAFLMSLCSIHRSSELTILDRNSMAVSNGKIIFALPGLVKHSRQGKPNNDLEIVAHLGEETLCPVKTLKIYLDRTKDLITLSPSSKLIRSFIKPHDAITTPTLARWLIEVMAAAGIDTTTFKAHSIRAAGSSKAKVLGLSLKDILRRGNWSNESTWQTFYHKKIIEPDNFLGKLFGEGK